MTLLENREIRNSREFVVVGIHLAGARSKRSALVRGRFKVNEIFYDFPDPVFERLKHAYAAWFPGLECVRLKKEKLPAGLSPLMVDVHVAQLGPESGLDADTVLFQAVSVLGAADFYVFDAPLSLPPCTNCQLSCPGSRLCRVNEVSAMNEMWRVSRLKGRKEKDPQPYVDRYFDYFARHVLDERSQIAGLQFEPSLGSNRAPLTARARYLAKRLQNFSPRAVFFETQSVVAAMAWELYFQTKASGSGLGLKMQREVRNSFGRFIDRQNVSAGLLGTGRLNFGLSLDSSLKKEFYLSPEVFYAGISALIPRSLAAGEVFFQDALIDMILDNVSIPLLPAAVGHYIEQGAELKECHEPI